MLPADGIEYRRANKQYIPMTADEVWRFLDSRSTLFVAFVGTDGYPNVTPVWFVVRDRTLWFRGASYKVKFGLAEGAKVCCTCADGERYTELRGVVIWGRSTIVAQSASLDEAKSLMNSKYAGRVYRPAEVPASWVRARRAETSTWVAIQPERISSWDNTKLRDGLTAAR